MLLPIEWLKEYIPKLPDPDKLAELLMMHGLEVEESISGGDQFENVVVGEIVAIRPHPNADKLRLADVIIALDAEPLEIVCGAPNIEVKQKVPVALLGAKLPNGLTIAKRAIRGVESNGMLCAADELGLGNDHAGILVLDQKIKIGTPLAEALKLNEVIFDLAIPANRADLMSVRGLAREIAAMLGTAVKLPTVKLKESLTPVSVGIGKIDAQLAPVYTLRVIRGVKVQPSPAWVQQRLRAAGMRSINAVVDATNYILLEYGQPLHAFDLAKVNGDVSVRKAVANEKLVTLDAKPRHLETSMTVIADDSGAIALAGVMGGENTEVSNTTVDILLESAIFDPVSIRKTSRQLGLVSEASKRFEKGLWPSLPVEASDAAAAMIIELCGGAVEQGMVGTTMKTKKAVTIAFNPNYVPERLGMTVTSAKIKTILTKLGFAVKGTAKKWVVTVPEWRLDVSLPEDLVDEVGRMVGYEKLPMDMPSAGPSGKDLPIMIRFQEEVRNILVEMGFTQVISHAFYGDDNAKIIKGNHFEVANPLDSTQHKLRKSQLPQIDDILKREADAGRDAMVFEMGNVFNPELPGTVDRQQSWKLALGITHKGGEALKEMLSVLHNKLQTDVQPESFTVAIELVRGRTIEFCEFDLKALMSGSKLTFGPWDPSRYIVSNAKYKEQSKFPAITRDISFWWEKDESALLGLLDALGIAILHRYDITDRFVKDDRTSYKVSFIYQSLDRTLTKEEVDKQEQKTKDTLVKFGATIR